MKAAVTALAVSLALAAGSAEAQTAPPPYPPPAYPPPPPPTYTPPPPPTYTPPPPPPYYPPARVLPPTAHRHLGFALRLDGGFGYTSSTASSSDQKMEGGSGAFGILIGGAVSENFILGGELWGTTAFSPTFSQGGTSVPTSDTTFGLYAIGFNVTYYFMPANVYLSASPSISKVTINESGSSFSTDAGFGMKLAVGKEWWVGDHWGIGIAGQFFFATNKDQGFNPPTWNSAAGAIAFSATFN